MGWKKACSQRSKVTRTRHENYLDVNFSVNFVKLLFMSPYAASFEAGGQPCNILETGVQVIGFTSSSYTFAPRQLQSTTARNSFPYAVPTRIDPVMTMARIRKQPIPPASVTASEAKKPRKEDLALVVVDHGFGPIGDLSDMSVFISQHTLDPIFHAASTQSCFFHILCIVRIAFSTLRATATRTASVGNVF